METKAGAAVVAVGTGTVTAAGDKPYGVLWDPERQDKSHILLLDDLTLRRYADLYPEPMREPVMWLGWFIREHCSRDLDVFIEKSKALGIHHDKTTWSKVLRGKWNQDKHGNPLPNPVVSLPNFLKALRLLREDHRVSEMAGKVPFIETSTTKRIFGFIDRKRAPDRVNRFGVVVAPTGNQKTASFQEYARQHNHGLCVWLEAPENGSVSEFICSLGRKYGGAKNDAYQLHRKRVLATVQSRNTVIVDNAQSLYREQDGANQKVFNFLRRMQEETKCTIILSWTPDFQKKITERLMEGYFEQFEGRAGGRDGFLILDDYPPEEDCVAVGKAFGLREADRYGDYLAGIAQQPGRIRRLFEVLQNAKIVAEAEGKALTIGLVKAENEE